MHIYILPQCSTTAASVLNSAGMDAQFERSCCAISRGILTYELKKKQTVLENQAAQLAELKERTEKLLAIKINLESVIETAKSENENLKTAKEKAENTIAQVQQMAGNSAKQELEGFKAKLSSEMSYAIKCYQDGCAEDEKAEIYGALLEEMIDVLANNGTNQGIYAGGHLFELRN